MYLSNKEIHLSLSLTENELNGFIERQEIEIHKDYGYLGNSELLEYLKDRKIIPQYINSYSFKIETLKGHFGTSHYMHIYYNQKLVW